MGNVLLSYMPNVWPERHVADHILLYISSEAARIVASLHRSRRWKDFRYAAAAPNGGIARAVHAQRQPQWRPTDSGVSEWTRRMFE